MNISASTKIRVIGGASALALSAGLGTAVMAQNAPAPVTTAPTPTAPLPPAGTGQCQRIDDMIVCSAGTSADGIEDFTGDDLELSVVEGAFVQGPIDLLGPVTGAVEGAVITDGDFEGALALGDGSNVLVDGFIQTSGSGAFGVATGEGSTLTNNGTIYTTGNDFSDAVVLGEGSLLENFGVIQTDGDGSFGVFGDGSDTQVVNGIDGSIFTAGDQSTAIVLGDNATVTNDGLVQTFGEGSFGVDVLNSGEVANSGNIVTSGQAAFGISALDAASISSTGLISTTGDSSVAISAGFDATVMNDGTIETSGNDAVAIFTDDGALISLGEDSDVTTRGDNAGGILILGSGEVENLGALSTDGLGAQGITILEEGLIVNAGAISTLNARAVQIGGLADITNLQTGEIFAIADDAVTFETMGSVLTNDGLIVSDGGNAIEAEGLAGITIQNAGIIEGTGVAINAGADATVTNSGTISTIGGLFSDAILVGSDSTIANSGLVQTVGDVSFGVFSDGAGISVDNELDGIISVSGTSSFAVAVGEDATITNDGIIETLGDDAFALDALSGATIANTGEITTAGAGSTAISVFDDANITNDGLIATTGENSLGIFAGFDTTIAGSGMVSTEGDNAIAIAVEDGSTVSLGTGSTVSTSGQDAAAIVVFGTGEVTNMGSITTEAIGSQGVTFFNDGSLTNTGSISVGETLAVDVLGAADIENSGLIDSLDIAINLGGSGTVTNSAGATIGGSVGIDASLGANDEVQTVANFGTIEGRTTNPQTGRIDAVLLGGGNDAFEQWTGASVVGSVDMGSGDDTFILEGASSTIAGDVLGGTGNDTAILSGTLDSDNFEGFETFQLGSSLGGSLNDLVISGNRSVDGDVVHVGVVSVGLGVDTLTTSGSITLEETGVLNIETPLDEALIGQTVLVLDDGTGFTDNGATLNIIDNDLLIDYTPVIGSLSVQVNAANPLVVSQDSNVQTFGTALSDAVSAGTLSGPNFALLNGLTLDELEAGALDALPNLGGAEGREIFETSQMASAALTRHLASGTSGVWGQAVIRGATQDERSGPVSASAGSYQSDQLIFTVGGDLAVGENGQIGVIASYADIENDDFAGGTTRSARGTTQIESYKLGAYAAFSFLGGGFLNGDVSYVTGEIDSARGGLFGPISSAYDFDGISYNATIGYDLIGNQVISVVPSVGLSGASISFDDTVETGGFGSAVVRDDAKFLELRAGLELGAELSPSISGHLGGTYVEDLEDERRGLVLSSIELGTIALALQERDTSRFEVGGGLTFDVTDTFKLEAGYLGDFASGYDAHSARLTARIAF